MSRHFQTAFAAVLSLTLGWSASAADRALIVGVGDYAHPEISDLKGIDLDVAMAQGIARDMGFDDESTRVLFDAHATSNAVHQSIEQWLGSAGPDDRVLFYFSGHGSQIPDEGADEHDGLDEILLTHDTLFERGRLVNGLVDDDFAMLLSNLRSREVLVLVDACNSGSVNKGVPEYFSSTPGYDPDPQAKFVDYRRLQRLRARSPKSASAPSGQQGFLSDQLKGRSSHAALSAAADDEFAIATSAGSIFTLGLVESITATRESEGRLGLRELHQQVRQYIEQAEQSFSPVLSGDERLIESLTVCCDVEGTPERGERWRLVEALVDASEMPVSVSAGATDFAVGDRLSVETGIPFGGYVTVLNVGADDHVSILFPNALQPEEVRITEGAWRFPDSVHDFSIRTSTQSLGEQLVAVIVSDEPLNLYESALASRNAKGDITAGFGEPELSQLGMQTLRTHFNLKGDPWLQSRGAFRVDEDEMRPPQAGVVALRACERLDADGQCPVAER